MKQINLHAPIQAGFGAAGILIGDSVHELPMPLKRRQLTGVEKLEYASVAIWVRNGVVDQIGVSEGYRGKLSGVIGIGSSIADVDRALGTVIEDDEDNLIVATCLGWSFETAAWRGGHRVEDNQHARITEMFVYRHEP